MDRNIKNILALGHGRLARGIPVLWGGVDVKKNYTTKLNQKGNI